MTRHAALGPSFEVCRAQLAAVGFAPAEAYALHLTALMTAADVELAELREHYPPELLEM